MTPLADLLAEPEQLAGGIIACVEIKIGGHVAVARVARTSADRAIVAAVARRDPHGTVVLALSGVARRPVVVDDPETLEPPGDFRGTSEYRKAMAEDSRHPGTGGTAMITIHITLNGTSRELACAPGDTLLTVLRREGLTSVRFGSETGETGAAGVLLDGVLVSSDVLLAAKADGHDVTTVESLDVARGELHPVQAAFVETGAMQSGYSAGAMVLAAVALLKREPDPSEAEIRDAFSGILDRETGYVKAIEAVTRAAAVLRGEKPDPFEPLVVRPLTGDMAEQGEEADARADVSPVSAPDAVPRFVPSPDVAPTAVVGKPAPKVDALALVKGKPVFTDDVELRGLLHAKVLRSPHAHARILDIDDREARALPGVHAVVHYGNTPRVKYASGGQSAPNPYPWDQVSFDDKVRHVGDRVAAVAADTLEIAEEACRRIKVTYEVLPAVFEPEAAMVPGAPVVHDEDDSLGVVDTTTNVSSHVEGRTVKDMEAAFAKADHVFEGTFRVQRVQHCAIEPHVTIGWLDPDERLVIRTSTQVPFHVRRMLAPLLGLPVKQIRVIKPRIGGGFGGKQEMLIEDIVGHLVLATRRPVRLELTRDEEFVASRTRHAQTLRFRTGVTNDGQLVAQDMSVVSDTGPYGVHGFTVSSVTGLRALSSYNCPAKQFNCDVVYTNGPVAGAMRGYGAPQGVFALESHIEDIARALGLDPIEFRRRNWVRANDRLDIVPRLGERGGSRGRRPRGPAAGGELRNRGVRRPGAPRHRLGAPGRPRLEDATGPAGDSPGHRLRALRHGLGHPRRGHGGRLDQDERRRLLQPADRRHRPRHRRRHRRRPDCRRGARRAPRRHHRLRGRHRLDALRRRRLRVGHDLHLRHGGEEGSDRRRPADRRAGGGDLRAGLTRFASSFTTARRWAPDGRSISLAEIAMRALHLEHQEQIMGVGSHLASASPSPFAAQVAEVEVDVETGQVTVKKFVTAVDCGVAVNPLTASGQVEGAVLMGLGYALTEELVLDADGQDREPAARPVLDLPLRRRPID